MQNRTVSGTDSHFSTPQTNMEVFISGVQASRLSVPPPGGFEWLGGTLRCAGLLL